MAIRLTDFPFWLRALLVSALILFSLNALIFVASVTAIVALLSASNLNPAVTALVGTALGAALTVIGNHFVAGKNRKEESESVSISLYSEIADRAARSLHDYYNPWENFDKSRIKWEVSRVERFRPASPVVYTGVAAKIGSIRKDALFSVIIFYFYLDAVRREIDGVLTSFSHDDDILIKGKPRLALVKRRLNETFKPALEALQKLDVKGAELIDDEAKRAYRNLRDKKDTLRELLRKAPEPSKSFSGRVRVHNSAASGTPMYHLFRCCWMLIAAAPQPLTPPATSPAPAPRAR